MRKKTPRISKLALDRTYLVTEPPFTNSADKNCHKCLQVHDCLLMSISFRSSGIRCRLMRCLHAAQMEGLILRNLRKAFIPGWLLKFAVSKLVVLSQFPQSLRLRTRPLDTFVTVPVVSQFFRHTSIPPPTRTECIAQLAKRK